MNPLIEKLASFKLVGIVKLLAIIQAFILGFETFQKNLPIENQLENEVSN